MGFTVERNHFIKWSWVSEKYGEEWLFKIVPDRRWNLIGKMTAVAGLTRVAEMWSTARWPHDYKDWQLKILHWSSWKCL